MSAESFEGTFREGARAKTFPGACSSPSTTTTVAVICSASSRHYGTEHRSRAGPTGFPEPSADTREAGGRPPLQEQSNARTEAPTAAASATPPTASTSAAQSLPTHVSAWSRPSGGLAPAGRMRRPSAPAQRRDVATSRGHPGRHHGRPNRIFAPPQGKSNLNCRRGVMVARAVRAERVDPPASTAARRNPGRPTACAPTRPAAAIPHARSAGELTVDDLRTALGGAARGRAAVELERHYPAGHEGLAGCAAPGRRLPASATWRATAESPHNCSRQSRTADSRTAVHLSDPSVSVAAPS